VQYGSSSTDPSSSQAPFLQQQQQQQSAPVPSFLQQQQQQLTLSAPQDTYMSSRAEALQNVESTIVELGGIFNKLSEMVSQQVSCGGWGLLNKGLGEKKASRCNGCDVEKRKKKCRLWSPTIFCGGKQDAGIVQLQKQFRQYH
jgi:hypothetical protein